MSILDRLEKGEITPDEAAKLLSENQPNVIEAKDPSESAMDVLGKLERGEISADEATQRLENKSPKSNENNTSTQNFAPRFEVVEERFEPARTWGWWFMPIAAGIFVTLLSGLWMSLDVRDGSFGWGFFCAWVPLAIGLLFIVFGVAARRGPWANLSINHRRRNGLTDLVFNMPVPVGMAGTVLRTAGRHIPGLEEADVDNLLNALKESQRKGEHITIQARDDNDDEDVVDITLG
jgi:hypothetical protein